MVRMPTLPLRSTGLKLSHQGSGGGRDGPLPMPGRIHPSSADLIAELERRVHLLQAAQVRPEALKRSAPGGPESDQVVQHLRTLLKENAELRAVIRSIEGTRSGRWTAPARWLRAKFRQ